ADRLGRRPTMLLNAVLFLFSAVATGLAGSAAFFIAARLVGGLAIGAASVLAPMYISEVAPSHMRGRLASLQQMAIVLGLFGAFLSNDVLVRLAGGASATFWLGAPAWRWMFWMEAVPAAAFLLGALFIRNRRASSSPAANGSRPAGFSLALIVTPTPWYGKW